MGCVWKQGIRRGHRDDMSRIRVAVLFGGRSGEHEVSLASARSVMAALDKDKYEVFSIGIDQTGRWITQGDPMALLTEGVANDASPEPCENANEELPAALRRRELVPGTTKARFPVVDVVFPVLHGTYGEDGTVQGLLELADLAYVGGDVLGSAVGMDKVIQKAVLRAHGIPIVDYVAILRSHWLAEPDAVVEEIEGRLAYPMFTKPANAGSSVGVAKAHDREELLSGLALAARFDRKIVIEAGIDAREIECAVLGNDEPIASVVGEVVPCNEFYDYSAKYVSPDSRLYIPADLPVTVAEEVRDLAVRAFVALDCAGMARADFFVSRDTGKVYINELNTLPGFTPISMYPKLWAASGLPYPKLIDRLIELALERYADTHSSETRYSHDH